MTSGRNATLPDAHMLSGIDRFRACAARCVLILLAAVISPLSAFAQAPEKPVSTIDIPADIRSIDQSPDGRWLYVIAHDMNKPSGLYVLDVRDALKPIFTYYLPLGEPVAMRLAKDGSSIDILDAQRKTGNPRELVWTLQHVDLGNPERPTLVSAYFKSRICHGGRSKRPLPV